MEASAYEVSELFKAAVTISVIAFFGLSAWSLYRLMQLKKKEEE